MGDIVIKLTRDHILVLREVFHSPVSSEYNLNEKLMPHGYEFTFGSKFIYSQREVFRIQNPKVVAGILGGKWNRLSKGYAIKKDNS